MNATHLAGLAIIVVAVVAVVRRLEVRLVLLLAALALGAVAGDVPVIFRTFLATLTKEQFVVPICCAMGFAYVLRHTGCDQHLVQLLVRPLRHGGGFLIPGAVLVGFLVNIPIISQTSTAVAIGAVLVPLLRAARISAVTTGAALLLGSSLGGELLNPGAPELITVSTSLKVEPSACVVSNAPLLLLHLVTATLLFWLISLRAERRQEKELELHPSPMPEEQESPPFRVNVLKALVPLVPLGLLFLTALPGLQLLHVPHDWLVPAEEDEAFGTRLIGAAMLVGAVIAALVSFRRAAGAAKAFFEGAGYAFAHIISLIVTAQCFGKGVELIQLDALMGQIINTSRPLLIASSGLVPMAFAFISGSGYAATQSLFRLFVDPANELGVNPIRIGSVVSLGAAAGRTMSPVAAVVLMCASMTETNPVALIRRVAVPLLIGMTIVVAVALLMATAAI